MVLASSNEPIVGFHTSPKAMRQLLQRCILATSDTESEILWQANAYYEADLRRLSKLKGRLKDTQIRCVFQGIQNDQLRALYFVRLAESAWSIGQSACLTTAILGLCDITLRARQRGVRETILQKYLDDLLAGNLMNSFPPHEFSVHQAPRKA